MKENETIIAVVIVFAVIILFGGFGMMGFSSYGYGGMMGNFGYGFGGMWLFGSLFMVLILVALVLFIAWLIKQLQKSK